jgi:hypothetical protein
LDGQKFIKIFLHPEIEIIKKFSFPAQSRGAAGQLNHFPA